MRKWQRRGEGGERGREAEREVKEAEKRRGRSGREEEREVKEAEKRRGK